MVDARWGPIYSTPKRSKHIAGVYWAHSGHMMGAWRESATRRDRRAAGRGGRRCCGGIPPAVARIAAHELVTKMLTRHDFDQRYRGGGGIEAHRSLLSCFIHKRPVSGRTSAVGARRGPDVYDVKPRRPRRVTSALALPGLVSLQLPPLGARPRPAAREAAGRRTSCESPPALLPAGPAYVQSRKTLRALAIIPVSPRARGQREVRWKGAS